MCASIPRRSRVPATMSAISLNRVVMPARASMSGTVQAKEIVPASRKLAQKDAAALAKQASKVIVAKGKKVTQFAGGKQAVAAMLGPTGNLRAPTIRKGKTLVVGFHEEVFEKVFG